MTIAHSASVNKWRRASARLRDMRPKRPDRRRPERPRHRGCQAAVLRRPADTHSRGNRLFRHLPSINYGIIASRRQMGSGVKQSPDFHDTWIAWPLPGDRVVRLVPLAGRIQQEHVRPRRVAHGVRRGACCRVSPLWRRFHTAGVSRPTNGQESIPPQVPPPDCGNPSCIVRVSMAQCLLSPAAVPPGRRTRRQEQAGADLQSGQNRRPSRPPMDGGRALGGPGPMGGRGPTRRRVLRADARGNRRQVRAAAHPLQAPRALRPPST